MARIRSLKPEAFQSETLAEVSLNAERTFFGLSTIADDRGRIVDKPAQINGELWSMRGNHTADELEAELVELEKCNEPLICRYVGCDGKRYLHLVTWDNHQRIDNPSKPRLPKCPHHPISVTGREEKCGRHEGSCPATLDSVLPGEISRESREIAGDPRGVSPDSPGVSVPDLGSRTLDRGSRTEERPAHAGATLPGTALLDDYLANTTPRPSKDDIRKLGEAIDRLVADTPVDVVAEALARYRDRDKARYGLGILTSLVTDIVKERAGQARASPNGRGPKNPNYTDEDYANGGWQRTAP